MTDDLPTRLLAKIAEREALAEGALDGAWTRWSSDAGKYQFGVNTVRTGIDVYAPVPEHAEAVSRYLEDVGPASVLRLCQAHREIVGEHRWAKQKLLEARAAGAAPHHVAHQQGAVDVLQRALAILALGYGIEEGP